MRHAADILIWHHGEHLNLFFRTVWVFGVNVSCFILKGLLAFVLLWFTLPVFVFFHIVLLVWPLPHPSSLLCVFQSVFFRLLLSVCLFAPRVFVVHPSFSFLFSLLNFPHPVVFFSFVSCLLLSLLPCCLAFGSFICDNTTVYSNFYIKKLSLGLKVNIFHEDISARTT